MGGGREEYDYTVIFDTVNLFGRREDLDTGIREIELKNDYSARAPLTEYCPRRN